MKRKDLVLYTFIFLACVVSTAEIVTYQLTGNHLLGSRQQANLQIPNRPACTKHPAQTRPATADAQLKALPEYEQACKSAFLDDMMIFTNMPVSNPSAIEAADKMTLRLREFDSQKIAPIVIMEPDSEWGLVDFHEYATGYYDEWIATYFTRLKENGITDEAMGLWIPFPEPQQPTWNNSNPEDFAYSVNRYFKSMRQVFPKAKTGILLDSQAGESNKASQLLAYTRLVDNALVDVAGLQGFPWHPSDENDPRTPLTSASEFAPAYLLEEVAKSLDTKEVLLNIGTYRHRKVENGGDVAITSAERQTSLNSILHEISLLKKQKYTVTVNIFAENKINTKEGVDWSYWQAGNYQNSEQSLLFTDFIHRLKEANHSVGIYDSRL